MRNKLVFPNGGTETKYAWDRYSLTNEGQHIWDKCLAVKDQTWTWDKYKVKSVGEDAGYIWEKYSTIQLSDFYHYEKYPTIPPTTGKYVWRKRIAYASNKLDYIWNEYEEKENTSFRGGVITRYGDGFIVLLHRDHDKSKIYSVKDMIANNFVIDEPGAYGFYGFYWSPVNLIKPSTFECNYCFSYPMYYTLSSYKHYIRVEDDKLVIMSGYLTGMTLSGIREIDNPKETLSWGISKLSDEVVDILTSDEIDTYPRNGWLYIANNKIEELTEEESAYYHYDDENQVMANDTYVRKYYFYELINDGFINNESLEAQIDYDAEPELLTTIDKNEYKVGFNKDNTYFYKYAGHTVGDPVNVKGDYIQNVKSTDRNAYPDNGYQDGYWYVFQKIGYHYWDKYAKDPADATITHYWDQYDTTKTQTIRDVMVSRPINTYNGRTFYLQVPEGLTQDDIKISLKNDEYVLDGGTGTDSNWYFSSTLEDKENYYKLHCPSHQNNVYITVSGNTRVYPNYIIGNYYPISQITQIVYATTTSAIDGKQYSVIMNNDTQMYLGYYKQSAKFKNVYEIINANVVGCDFGDTRQLATAEEAQNNIYRFYFEDAIAIEYQDIYNATLEDVSFSVGSTKNEDFNINNRNIYMIDGVLYRFSHGKEQYEELEYITTTYGKTDNFLRELSYVGDSTRYPHDGAYNGRWYIYTGSKDDNPILETVKSRNQDAYPIDAYGDDGYYYDYTTFELDLAKGDFIEQITTNYPNAFPSDGYRGGYWYVFNSTTINYFKGELLSKENAFDKNKYPVEGKQGDYWYSYVGYENNGPYKYRFIDQVESNNLNAYPQDGIEGNYWFVYNKSYEGYKLQIQDYQIRGGVNYQQNINPENDYTVGNVSMAQVDFTYDNTNNDLQQYLDQDYFLYYTWQMSDNDWKLIGKFYIDDADYNRTKAKIKAYDAIAKTEKFIDSFIDKVSYPVSLNSFFYMLLKHLGLNGKISGSNMNQLIYDNFQAINITGRQILQYIAEMAGGYCKADKEGNIVITPYKSSSAELDRTKYTKYEKSRFSTNAIDGLTVRMNSDDLGVSSGNIEGNAYIVENNPLFYTQTESGIKPAVSNLLNALKKVSYTPGTIELLEDFGIEVGDVISINGNTFYVMSKTLSASGCKLECFGNQYREKQPQSINSDIVALRGKTNELVRDLDKTQSKLTDTANKLQSQITQTASSIRSEVSDLENELSSTIEQTASSITSTVSDNKKELESKIQQTADSITSTVSKQGEVISEIRQDLDGISLTYNSEQGTASITIGDITISELVDGKYVDRVVAGIDFSGYCRFSDLSTPGQTIICGDNITTGTISADRIELTGSISWGDLSDSCQDTIASFAGSGGSGGEVPSYIKSTYIDATTIKSPTIYGAKIYAGTSAEGYIKLASTGMNFYSNSGGSVCGIGYYPGKYSLPYIMLGQGVDDAGTDKGMIKKYTNGIWIGDSDNVSSNSPGGTGIFINFTSGKIQKYINGSVSTL